MFTLTYFQLYYLLPTLIAVIVLGAKLINDLFYDLDNRNKGIATRRFTVNRIFEALFLAYCPVINIVFLFFVAVAAFEEMRNWMNVHWDIPLVGEKHPELTQFEKEMLQAISKSGNPLADAYGGAKTPAYISAKRTLLMSMGLPVDMSGTGVPVLVPGTPIRIHEGNVDINKAGEQTWFELEQSGVPELPSKTFWRKGVGIAQVRAREIDGYLKVILCWEDEKMTPHTEKALQVLNKALSGVWQLLPEKFSMKDIERAFDELKQRQSEAAPSAPEESTKGSADDL